VQQTNEKWETTATS